MTAPKKLRRIEEILCEVSGISIEDLYTGKGRHFSKVRHMVWFVARTELGFPFMVLARIYKRDHTSIMYGVDKIGLDKNHERIAEKIRSIDPNILIGGYYGDISDILE